MRKFSFTKMNGAGNDFIILDEEKNPGLSLDSALIQKLCDRRFGIGADGLMTIADAKDSDFRMTYYNSDGSTGSLCGNGSRCALMYFYTNRQNRNKSLRFDSLDKHYKGDILNSMDVRFYLSNPECLKLKFMIKAAGQLIKASFINTGSPHIVINISDVLIDEKNLSGYWSDLASFPVFRLGKEIRMHEDFQPEGANVNFYSLKDGKIFIRTFERGVEDETFACGTGAAATAIVSSILDDLKTPATLVTKAGKILTVDFMRTDERIENVTLSGPAETNFNGTITI